MGARRTRAVGGGAVVALTAGLALALPATATAAVSADSPLVINEVYGAGGSSGAVLDQDFVELYNKGTTAIDLSTHSLQYASAAGTGWNNRTTLTGSVGPGEYYLVGLATGSTGEPIPAPDHVGTNVNLSGTNGNVALSSSTAQLMCQTTSCATDDAVVDLVGFGDGAAFAGSAPAPSPSSTMSTGRTGFVNTADNGDDFTVADPTPNAVNPEPAPAPEPVDPTIATIAEIQGSEDTANLDGQTVTTTGVVTAAYPDGGLAGFNLQTGGTGGNRDDTDTSDGIFVYTDDAPVTVEIGDSVSVTGVVSEFFGLTQITSTPADIVDVVAPLPAVTPATTSGWPATDAEREKLESMLYAPGEFTVSNTFSLSQSSGTSFGEVGLAFGDKPLIQPTDVADAQDTAAVAAVEADNDARAVILDDGSTMRFGIGTVAPPYVSLTNPVQVGGTVNFTDGVIVGYGFDSFRFQPTSQVTQDTPVAERPSFTSSRTAAPEDVGGNLSVASFNVLNYFTTVGADLQGCTSFDDREGDPVTVNRCPDNGPRGAFEDEDLQRQQDKIVSAINLTDAAVTGLMEIENSASLGEEVDEATATLVAALNDAAGEQKWAFVPSSSELPPTEQQDVITNAIIYQPALVARLGESRALGDRSGSGEPFSNAREPLGQAFTPTDDGEPFFVAVNHFKSKGSAGPLEGDEDQNDGQARSNASRVAQAEALSEWVPTVLPEGVEASFLLGDFNSYTQEDPLQVLYADGYTNVNQAQTDADDAQADEYSYSFSGLSGSLDHVLANDAALERTTGSDNWTINSGEVLLLEYSRFNSHPTLFYADGPYRSSDHDPVIVGFESQVDDNPDPEPQPFPNATGRFFLTLVAGGSAQSTVTFGDAGDTGLTGDFDGDGTDEVGVFDDGLWTLGGPDGSVAASFSYGSPGDLPLVGDWDSDGTDTVGVYRSGVVFLRNTNTTGVADIAYTYGRSGDVPVAGDFDGDGDDTVGIRRASTWYLRNASPSTTGANAAELAVSYGRPGDLPLVGDFNADGVDALGVVRGNQWFLSNSNTRPTTNQQFSFGRPGDRPLAGSYAGFGFDGVGVFRI